MTQEEKARAYDKALEKARAMYGGIPADNAMLEEIFPELAESEDERIRKYFIWIVKNVLNNIQGLKLSEEQTRELIDNYSGIKESDMLAYLEKQKEQKPELLKPHKGDDTNPYDMSVSEAQEYAINRGFGIPFNDGEVYVDERHMTQTIGNILRWADEHPKEQKPIPSNSVGLKEQKPAECASILAFIDSLPEDDPLNDPRFGEGFDAGFDAGLDAGRAVQRIFDGTDEDSLPEETSCIYDTNELTPTPSVNVEDVARVQFASHAHVFDRKRKAVFDWEQFKEVAGIFYGFGKRDSLPEDDIPKIEGWIARNKDESLVFCYHKPKRENSITLEWWGSCDADFRIYDDTIDEQFKDLKWEDEPREVELIIKCRTCKESLQVQDICKENPDSFTDKPKEMSVDEAMAYLEEKIAKASKSWEGIDVDKFLDDLRGREPDDLEEAAEFYAKDIIPLSSKEYINHVEYDAFIAGAKWQAKQLLKGSPLPEDTILFQKGVEEGRRLEREDRNDDNLPRFYGD